MSEWQSMILWQVVVSVVVVLATIVFFIQIVKVILYFLDAADEPSHNGIESSTQSLVIEDRYRTRTIDDLHRGFITEEKARRRIAASNNRSRKVEAEHNHTISGSNGQYGL